MNIYDAIYRSVLVLFVILIVNVHIKASNQENQENREDIQSVVSINETSLRFLYSNSNLGKNKQIPIVSGNERSILEHWIQDSPLKITTHGWLSSDYNYTGVFTINNAYIDTGGFNVISMDWSSIAHDPKYPVSAALTTAVGSAMAAFLDRLVDATGIKSSDIHLIGHSLGAHVVGSCGSNFKSGKIGRITGLDPAAPGFEILPIHLPHLSKKDAQFVDIIHTSGGIIGFFKSIGHADFFPNSGLAPQPGCFSLFKLLDFSCYNKNHLNYPILLQNMDDYELVPNCRISSQLSNWFPGCLQVTYELVPASFHNNRILVHCSHSKSYELYADSVYNRNSYVAVKCQSWDDYTSNKCENNTSELMGHGASPNSTGNFYLKTGNTING